MNDLCVLSYVMEAIYILFFRAFILHFHVNPLVCFSVLMEKKKCCAVEPAAKCVPTETET